jgi:hypothetical protein
MTGIRSPHRLLASALRAAWSKETSLDPNRWSDDNPAVGQCAVSALIVQDVYGGSLLRCESPTGSHYYNRLADGSELDLTREQFREAFSPRNVEVRSRDYVLSFEGTRRRYELLKARAEGR